LIKELSVQKNHGKTVGILESKETRKYGEYLGENQIMTKDEAKARWICCPMCDKERCERGADDCDVKRYMQGKAESEDRG
jgi:hypothetical protein